jgi:hypothetical protein
VHDNAIATLTTPDTVRLPVSYTRARDALTRCDALDECIGWSNKAEALASYAKQARDESLRLMAGRIHDRAVRRAGELLDAIPMQPGTGRADRPTVGPLSRTATARAAGMSEHQQVQAVRVARVPAVEFERLVESPTPPTVTELARRGRKSKATSTPTRGRPPKEKPPAHPYAAALPVLRDVAGGLKWLADETSGRFRRPLATCYRRVAKLLTMMERAQ